MGELNTARVIEEVSTRPVLWDWACVVYKSRKARQAAWTSICNNIIDNYEDLDVGEQRRLELKIQQRWRTARDCYVKMQSSKLTEFGKSKKCKPYAYSEQLKFLDPTLGFPVPAQGDVLAHRAERRMRMRANRMLRDKLNKHQMAQRHEANNMRHEKATMTLFEKNLLSYLKKDDSPLDADDNDFFKSLGPILRGFDSNQKLLFRSRVLSTAMDIQNDVARCTTVTASSSYADHSDECNPLQEEPVEDKYRPPGEYSALYVEAEPEEPVQKKKKKLNA